MYLSYNNGFSDIDPNGISSKLQSWPILGTMVILLPVILVGICQTPFQSRLFPHRKSISIRLSIGIQVRSFTEGSSAILSSATVSVSSVGTLIK